MAYFAKLNKNNIVEDVISISNNVLLDENGVEQESLGVDLCKYIYNYENFKQTYDDGGFRKNYAALGFSYDSNRDAFIPPKPYASWTLDETTCLWKAPVARPDDGQDYFWNEETTTWDLITL